jgi:hypothetical protein
MSALEINIIFVFFNSRVDITTVLEKSVHTIFEQWRAMMKYFDFVLTLCEKVSVWLEIYLGSWNIFRLKIQKIQKNLGHYFFFKVSSLPVQTLKKQHQSCHLTWNWIFVSQTIKSSSSATNMSLLFSRLVV